MLVQALASIEREEREREGAKRIATSTQLQVCCVLCDACGCLHTLFSSLGGVDVRLLQHLLFRCQPRGSVCALVCRRRRG
jgi:hypothetical protein